MVAEFKQYKRRKSEIQHQDPEHKRPVWTPLLAEFIGTLIFTFVTIAPVVIGNRTGDLANAELYMPRGLIILALIYAFGAVSGAHFNPAVTLAFALRKAFPWKDVPRYILMQFLGALAGAYVLSMLFGGAKVWAGPDTTLPQAFFIETFFAFVLVTVVLSTARQNKLIGHNAGLAVGATLAVIGMLAGPLTGGIVNPAKALGPAIVTGDLNHIWLYILAPLIAAGLAAWLTNAMHGGANEHEAEAALGRKRKEGHYS